MPVAHYLVAQRALGAQRQLVLGGLAVDDVPRAARRLGGMVSARAVALLAHHEQQPEIALRRLPAAPPTALIMEAMMPLVSQAPRPQMNSSSSREAKNGGTVSMWVESVTQRLAPLREDVEAVRLHFHALDAAAEAGGQRRQVVVEEIADALFVIGDGFDIDQRAREFEDVHK